MNHDVRGFEVAVDYVVRPQVLKTRAHFCDHFKNVVLLLLCVFVVRVLAVLKHVPQIPASAVFGNDVKETVVLCKISGTWKASSYSTMF